MNPLLRRGGVLLGAAALTVTTLTSPAQAVVYDAAPADAGATWLTGQLTGGLVHNDQYDFDDYGLSIDFALGLAGLGGHAGTVTEIANAVDDHVNSYTTGADFGTADIYAGPVAKAAVFAQTAGGDAASFGGVDLVSRLEDRVSTDAVTRGRIEDYVDPANAFGNDYANVIGQAYAAQALAAASSTRTDDVVNFLLKQQCGGGYFRLYFTPDKSAQRQRCVDGASGSEPDTDVTALALLSLDSLGSTDPDVLSAIADAADWLATRQRADGSFGGGPATEAPNSDSTGLAGWALGSLGDTAAASKAARWVRAHQIRAVGSCARLTNNDGATAYDGDALAEALKSGITALTQDQWRRASSQSLPVLAWAEPVTSALLAGAPSGYVKASSRVGLSVRSASPGSLCASGDGRNVAGAAGVAGAGSIQLRMPASTSDPVFTVTDVAGGSDPATFHVLGALRIPFDLAEASVARGERQAVHAHGLAPGEPVRVLLGGTEVAHGRAGDGGRFSARFLVTGQVGTAQVRVVGKFADIRHNAKTFTVTR